MGCFLPCFHPFPSHSICNLKPLGEGDVLHLAAPTFLPPPSLLPLQRMAGDRELEATKCQQERESKCKM